MSKECADRGQPEAEATDLDSAGFIDAVVGLVMATTTRNGHHRPTRRPMPEISAAQRQPVTRNDLLTPADVAAILQVQRSTALDYLRRGVIPGRKIGRNWFVLRSQLDAYLVDLFEMES